MSFFQDILISFFYSIIQIFHFFIYEVNNILHLHRIYLMNHFFSLSFKEMLILHHNFLSIHKILEIFYFFYIHLQLTFLLITYWKLEYSSPQYFLSFSLYFLVILCSAKFLRDLLFLMILE